MRRYAHQEYNDISKAQFDKRLNVYIGEVSQIILLVTVVLFLLSLIELFLLK